MSHFTPLETPVNDINALPIMHPGKPVGRDDILKTIYTHLQNKRPVLLYGASGNGKTTLAAALAAAYVMQPGGVIWLNERTHPLPALVAQLGRALQVNDLIHSEQPAAHIGALSTALTDKKPFIVLDNVVDALAPTQLINKAADNIPLLLISQQDIDGPWEKIAVAGLTDMDSAILFKQKSGLNNNDHDIDVYGITKVLGYQPLPIVLAARGMVAAKQHPADYLKNLKTIRDSSGDALMAAIALSYRSLNNALQGLLLMLGATFKGQASVDFIADVSGVPENGIEQAMTILAQLYLVQQYDVYGKKYYRLHPAVYNFAHAALEGKNQLAALQQKVHDSTLHYAEEHLTDPENLAKEMDNFIATAEWASDHGKRETASELVTALTLSDDFVQEGGYRYEISLLAHLADGGSQAFPAYEMENPLDMLEDFEDDLYDYDDDDAAPDAILAPEDMLLGQMVAARDSDSDYDDFDEELYDEDLYEDDILLDTVDDDAFDMPDLGDLTLSEGMNSQVLTTDVIQSIDIDELRQALVESKQQGNTGRTIQILKTIGKSQVSQDKETEAIATYSELLDIYDEQDNDEGVLDTLNMLGSLMTKTGNSQAAVMHATRGAQIAQLANDPITELQMHIILGDARQDLGETQSAVNSFKKALEIARQTDDKQHEAIALYKLGNAHLDNGATDDAIHSLEQARTLFKAQFKRDYEGRVLGALGSANSELEQWSEAIGYYTSALYIAREVEDREEERLQLSSLAQAQEQANKVGDALQSYRQALYLAYESDDHNEIVSAIVDLVRLLLISPVHLDIAKMLLEDALTRDPEDKDVLALLQQVNSKRIEATASGKVQKPVAGSAKEYAANAYQLI